MAEENAQNELEVPEEESVVETAETDSTTLPADNISEASPDASATLEPETTPEEKPAIPAEAATAIEGADSDEQTPIPPVSSVPQTTYEPTPRPVIPADTIPTLPVAVLLVGMGVILLWPVLSGGFILLPEIIAAILVAGIALSLLAYWLKSERKARGALFVALTGLIGAGLTGLFVLQPQTFALQTDWPLYLAGVGVAVLLTYIADQTRSRRFFTPAFVLIITGLIAITATRQIVPESVLDLARQGWPWVFGALVLGLLPLAFRRTINNT